MRNTPKKYKDNETYYEPILRLASKLPEYKWKCKLENNTLIIQGKCYNIEDISQLPENLLPIKATQKQDDTTIGYFSQLCLYCNFFHSKFVISNLTFKTSEHYVHYTKAMYCNDTGTTRKILECETPHQTASKDNCKLQLSKVNTKYTGIGETRNKGKI